MSAAAVQRLHQVLKVIHIPAHQRLDNVVLERPQDGAVGVAGDCGVGSALSVSHRSGIGVDLHDDVLNVVDRPHGRLKGGNQRDRESAQPNFCDFHLNFFLSFIR